MADVYWVRRMMTQVRRQGPRGTSASTRSAGDGTKVSVVWSSAISFDLTHLDSEDAIAIGVHCVNVQRCQPLVKFTPGFPTTADFTLLAPRWGEPCEKRRYPPRQTKDCRVAQL